MIYNQALEIVQKQLLPKIKELYALEKYEVSLIESHYGGRNIIYSCDSFKNPSRILRISFLKDRTREDYVSELEYVRYLCNHGASVANVINSVNDNILEEMSFQGYKFFICLFEKAKGKMLSENNYRYIKGASIEEYFFNSGKTLGKIHEISKGYTPSQRRYNFFDKFNMEYINKLIPDSLMEVKNSIAIILEELKKVPQNIDTFGMIHFDYNDGNYNIDYENGHITVYDFDNCLFGWYMYDLANLWVHGVGWIQFEKDTSKRKAFMDQYFSKVLEGYSTETNLDKKMLDSLPLFINAYIVENIVDEFEVLRNNEEKFVPEDEELQYLFKCITDNISYMGFFSDIYSVDNPFQYEN